MIIPIMDVYCVKNLVHASVGTYDIVSVLVTDIHYITLRVADLPSCEVDVVREGSLNRADSSVCDHAERKTKTYLPKHRYRRTFGIFSCALLRHRILVHVF